MIFPVRSNKNIGRLPPVKNAEYKDFNYVYSWGNVTIEEWGIEIKTIEHLINIVKNHGEVSLEISGGVPLLIVNKNK